MNISLARSLTARIGIILIALLTLSAQQVAAISQNDLNSILNNTPFYDSTSSQCYSSSTAATSSTTASASSSSGITINIQAAKQAAQAASSGGTNVGYALYDSTGKLLANYNDTFENYGASITKSMLLVAYLKQVGSGTLDPTAQTQLTDMIEDSANGSATAPGPAYWVYSHLNNGLADVNAIASEAGMTGFEADTSDPDYTLGQSKVTANDFAKFFSQIDTMFPAAQKSFALELLSNLSPTDQVGLLQAGLPGTVYSKEGWKPENTGLEGAPYIVNQAAQFSYGGTTYGVAVTVSGTSDQASGAAIVKAVVSALISQGGSQGASTPASTSTGGCCSTAGASVDTTEATGGSTTNNSSQPVIVLDPGHSGDDIHDTDPQTGLYDHDYPNIPEISEVFSVAQKVQSKLESDGYKVVMTKSSVSQDVSFRQRADIADQANAALAVSIHDSHVDTGATGSFDHMYGASYGGQVYTQNVGGYRQNQPGMGSGNQKVTFTDSAVAQLSNQYGKIFAEQRTQDEHHEVEVAVDSFDGRTDIAGGDLSEVQLFAKVPWVYNEVGAGTDSQPLTSTQLDEYAQGIIDGVEKSIPISNSQTQTSTSSAASDTTTSCCSDGSNLADNGSTANDNGTGSGSWNSGLSAPYIVEQYAINVLEDLAQKKGDPTSDAVTQQHVLALVVWAILEGGDINNDNLFNLWNSTWTQGVVIKSMNGQFPAYASFDDGVEASARTIAQAKDYPLADALLNPSSTAEQIAHAESYMGTSTYPNSQIWVGGIDAATYETTQWDPTIAEVQSNYDAEASLVIGTAAHEETDNITDSSKLSNINSGGFGSAAATSSCSGITSQGAAAIAQEALNLAWPEPFENKPVSETGRTSALTPTPAYQAAMQQYNPGALGALLNGGADCGAFVGTVMRASGADPQYPTSGTGSQWAYVVAHPEKYDIQYNVTDMQTLQAGDILIVGGPSGAGAAGHTWIYVGNQAGGYYSASASEGQRSGNLTNDQLTDPIAVGGYLRARLK